MVNHIKNLPTDAAALSKQILKATKQQDLHHTDEKLHKTDGVLCDEMKKIKKEKKKSRRRNS